MRLPQWEPASRVSAAMVLAGGVALTSVPAIAGQLDAWSGLALPPVEERTTITVVNELIDGSPPRTTRTETIERIPLLDRGLVARAFELPGATFVFRLVALVFTALLAGAFIEAIARARFRIQFGGVGVGAPDVATETLSRSLKSLREELAVAHTVVAPDAGARDRVPEPGKVAEAPVRPVYRPREVPEELRVTLTAAKRATERRYAYVADPRVAVLTLRADLEQRLRVLAEQVGLADRALPALVPALAEAGRISPVTAENVGEVIEFARTVEAGGRVSNDVLERIRVSAPDVLDRLDRLIFGGFSRTNT